MGDHHHTKTEAAVLVMRIEPVATGASHVPIIVVERTAAQHTVVYGRIPAT
jgi:hypothetical protein